MVLSFPREIYKSRKFAGSRSCKISIRAHLRFLRKIHFILKRTLSQHSPTKACTIIKRKIIFFRNNPAATNKIQLYIPNFARFLFSFIYFLVTLISTSLAKKAINYIFFNFSFRAQLLHLTQYLSDDFWWMIR